MADEDEAEKLLQQAKEQKRHETEPTNATDTSDNLSLESAVQQAYEQLDDGDIPENLTIRDEHLAALFAGLDETDGLEDVGRAAADALDRDADGLDTRVAVLKLLVRVGLDEVASESVEAAKEARREYLASQADEF